MPALNIRYLSPYDASYQPLMWKSVQSVIPYQPYCTSRAAKSQKEEVGLLFNIYATRPTTHEQEYQAGNYMVSL